MPSTSVPAALRDRLVASTVEPSGTLVMDARVLRVSGRNCVLDVQTRVHGRMRVERAVNGWWTRVTPDDERTS